MAKMADLVVVAPDAEWLSMLAERWYDDDSPSVLWADLADEDRADIEAGVYAILDRFHAAGYTIAVNGPSPAPVPMPCDHLGHTEAGPHTNVPVVVAFAEPFAERIDDAGRCARDVLSLAADLTATRRLLSVALDHLGDHHRNSSADMCPVCQFEKRARPYATTRGTSDVHDR